MIGGNFAIQREAPADVSVLPSHRDQGMRMLSFLVITFQKGGFWVLEKDSLGL